MARSAKTFTHEQELAFVEAATPHQWLLTAISLHDQAVTLWRNRGRALTTLKRPGQPDETWDDTNRATFLLAAFAMENMLKALLIYENPAFVAGGRLTEVATHDLIKLAARSSLVPYRTRDNWVFEALSEGNLSWARYPCGRDADDVRPEGQFTIDLWLKYCAMMEAYANKLRKLLTRGWTGPYGPHGTWEFTD